jgi:dienelactone hydrolase
MRFHYLFAVVLFAWTGFADEVLPGTERLTGEPDLAPQMIAGIDRFLMRELEDAPAERAKLWSRDFSSPDAYSKSVTAARHRFRSIIGAVDPRVSFSALEFVSSTEQPAKLATMPGYDVFAVRWPVFPGVFAEGLWIKPHEKSVARIIVVPDADQTPEMLVGIQPGVEVGSQIARRLAENGCEILIPTLVNRDDSFSGNSKINRFTNQPHREWIYRMSYELGRHIIGYEVQKVLAGVDWFSAQQPAGKIAVVGYGEGGLIAFYSGALDERINVTWVSGYFDAREKIWTEPIYRNLFGLLREFGDAEIATLITPRGLIIEHSNVRPVDGPPAPRPGRAGAAPGRIQTPDTKSVGREFARAQELIQGGGDSFTKQLIRVTGPEDKPVEFGSDVALTSFLQQVAKSDLKLAGSTPQSPQIVTNFTGNYIAVRQQRQVEQLVEHTQAVLRNSERERDAFLWKETKNAAAWPAASRRFQQTFWNDLIGRIEAPVSPINPRSRRVLESDKVVGYSVVLDVHQDVFAWGYLLMPKDLKPGERRPVVVCQHGLEGSPMDVVNTNEQTQAFHYYKAFATRLAERGFVVFAPQNPYRGGDTFRILQRKANPLGLSIFSFIISQHDQILNWLSEQPFVDPQRIGFYGLSYGGKTAMRVPSLLNRYALSICSGDFNEWIYKNVTTDFVGSYMFTAEHEMAEWNLGSTFGYAEMATLIAPRPFMVERGHDDGVGIDEWVSYEYAKVRRFYNKMNIGDRTEIEYFDGPHTINGKGTFEFLHKHLNWPAR